MKTMVKLIFGIAALILLLGSPGYAQQNRTAGNYPYETECLGSAMDGSITVKAWGNGRNRLEAVSRARKNAVRDVIFKGITKGMDGCNPRPLVPEVNAELKYEVYFNAFFSDNGGQYKNYVSDWDERLSETIFRERRRARHMVTYGVVIRVMRADLRQKLIDDGIIQQ